MPSQAALDQLHGNNVSMCSLPSRLILEPAPPGQKEPMSTSLPVPAHLAGHVDAEEGRMQLECARA
jgi:hypothetical protein